MPANRPANTLGSEAADRAFFPVSVSPTGRSYAVAFDGRLGRAYNQEAFRYLLAIEQARADRSRRSLLLALISIRTGSGEGIRFAPRVAARVFDALWLCIRDVDLTGWYTQDRVAGAVLTQDRTMPGADDILRIQSRINEALRGRIPSAVAGGLRVRVLRMGAAHSGDAQPPGQKESLAMAAAPV
jgi:hypothetical protein